MRKLLPVLSSTLQGGLRGGLLIFALLATTSLWAYDFQSGGLYYNITSNSTVEVTDANNTHSITIPRTVTYDSITYSVTRIGETAFYECSSLTSISIPNSITSIGYQAFFGCSSLTSITIPKNVTSIGSEAFSGCSSLTKTNYTGDIAGWCNIKFGNTSSSNPIFYSHNLYINGQEIKNLVIPNTVDIIHNNAFCGCSSLTSVTIPNSVTSIESGAFFRCSSLTSINIPNSVTSIGGAAFMWCTSLTSIKIPNGIASIGNYTFYDCSSLESITIPNSVTSIGDHAFYDCSSLASITIPDGVTIIKKSTFSGCSSLTSITIPNSVTSIENYAFSSCSSLTSATIGNSVTSIGENAFYNCSSLNSITIPNSVTSIGGNAFYKNIEEIYCYPITPPAVESSSFYNYSKATLYVPCDSKEVYEQHPVFGKFKNIKGIDDCGGGFVTTHIHETICQGEVYEFGEYLCDTTGTYTAIIGDVTTFLYLTVLPSSIDTITVEAYDSYEWHGVVYTESGVYTYSDPYNPCVIEELHLTIIDTPTPSEPQDTTIYHPTDYATICEGITFVWMGMEFTEIGTYTYEEIVEDENYIYHYIHTLELQVIVPPLPDTIVVEAYDSYEWHGVVYTESGTYIYEEHCYQEILQLTIISSEEKEYVHYYYNDIFVCDGDTYEDPITGIYHLIVEHTTWSDTITGTEVDAIYTFNITPIVAPKPLTEDILYAIGAVPELVAGEMVNTMGTTEPIMWYYQMNDKDDIADVIGVEWVAGHDVVLNTEQTTHTMVLEVWDECYNTRSMKFTFPVSKKDSAPQDTTIYHPTVYETICEGTTFTWMGMDCTEAGLYEYHEIVEGEDYTYHHIYTLELTILPYKRVEYEMIAYDSYEWHGWVYTESGTHTYQSDECTTEVLYLTIIPSGHNQGEVVVEPSTNSVTITWQKEESADSYIIVIKQGDKVICTLIFDAEGNLVSVNYLPGRESNKHGIQHAGLTSDSFQYTITGLTPSTDYTYTVTATDDLDNTISSYSGEFTTHHATSVENTHSPSPISNCQKIIRNGQLLILRDGKTYTIMGQEL